MDQDETQDGYDRKGEFLGSCLGPKAGVDIDIVEMDGEFITRLIEKPALPQPPFIPPQAGGEGPQGVLAIVGIYSIQNSELLFYCLDEIIAKDLRTHNDCLLYTSPSPRDGLLSRMPSSA